MKNLYGVYGYTLSHITMKYPCADMGPFGVARFLQQQRSFDGTGLMNPNMLNIYLNMIGLFAPQS